MGPARLLVFALLVGCASSQAGPGSDRIEGQVLATTPGGQVPLPQARVTVKLVQDDGHGWVGTGITNQAGWFAIDGLSSPQDFSATSLLRDRQYELAVVADGFYLHQVTVDYARRVQSVAVELQAKPLDVEDEGTVAPEDRVLGNGGKAPIRGG